MTVPAHTRAPDAGTTILVVLFLIGLYLGIAARLPGGIPVPGIIAGLAGALLLLTHRACVRERHVLAILGVLTLYLLSILTAPDYGLLMERFKGFVQLSYSMLIAYGFYLAVIRHSRARLAAIFMSLCVVILIGCALESYTGFGAISDAFRERFFESGVYIADLRDQILYGRIRPKLFTSEPSAVTFAFAIFAFAWYVSSRARGKVVGYLLLLAAAYYLMRGPTLLLAAALVPVYEILLASRGGLPGNRHLDLGRATGAVVLAALLVIAAIPLVQYFYAERLQGIMAGHDPSFFARVIAPPLVAIKIIALHPVTGAGLTGWEYLETMTQQVYSTAEWFSSDYRFGNAADSITNYFWLHWIFLGLFWGGVILAALLIMLRVLGVPSLLFCYIVWAVFGQGSGSYVGPPTWGVLFLAAALAVVYERERTAREAYSAMRAAYYHGHARRRQEPYLKSPQMPSGVG